MTTPRTHGAKEQRQYKINLKDHRRGLEPPRHKVKQSLSGRPVSAKKKYSLDLYSIYVPDKSIIHTDRPNNSRTLLSPALGLSKEKTSQKKITFKRAAISDNNQTNSLTSISLSAKRSPQNKQQLIGDSTYHATNDRYESLASNQGYLNTTSNAGQKLRSSNQKPKDFLINFQNQSKKWAPRNKELEPESYKARHQTSLKRIKIAKITQTSHPTVSRSGEIDSRIGTESDSLAQHENSSIRNALLSPQIRSLENRKPTVALAKTESNNIKNSQQKSKNIKAIQWLNYNFKIWEMETPEADDPLGLNAFLNRKETSFENDQRKFKMLSKRLWERENRESSKKHTNERFERLMEMDISRDIEKLERQNKPKKQVST